jgi:hypothetical protein
MHEHLWQARCQGMRNTLAPGCAEDQELVEQGPPVISSLSSLRILILILGPFSVPDLVMAITSFRESRVMAVQQAPRPRAVAAPPCAQPDQLKSGHQEKDGRSVAGLRNARAAKQRARTRAHEGDRGRGGDDAAESQAGGRTGEQDDAVSTDGAALCGAKRVASRCTSTFVMPVTCSVVSAPGISMVIPGPRNPGSRAAAGQ